MQLEVFTVAVCRCCNNWWPLYPWKKHNDLGILTHRAFFSFDIEGMWPSNIVSAQSLPWPHGNTPLPFTPGAIWHDCSYTKDHQECTAVDTTLWHVCVSTSCYLSYAHYHCSEQASWIGPAGCSVLLSWSYMSSAHVTVSGLLLWKSCGCMSDRVQYI